MSSLVMLRWVIPVGRFYASTSELIRGLISPAVRAGGWLCSPGTTHHVSRQGGEAWVTVVTQVDDATEATVVTRDGETALVHLDVELFDLTSGRDSGQLSEESSLHF